MPWEVAGLGRWGGVIFGLQEVGGWFDCYFLYLKKKIREVCKPAPPIPNPMAAFQCCTRQRRGQELPQGTLSLGRKQNGYIRFKRISTFMLQGMNTLQWGGNLPSGQVGPVSGFSFLPRKHLMLTAVRDRLLD
ncbi:unnamed protein product [Eretmochelys imbricata]